MPTRDVTRADVRRLYDPHDGTGDAARGPRAGGIAVYATSATTKRARAATRAAP